MAKTSPKAAPRVTPASMALVRAISAELPPTLHRDESLYGYYISGTVAEMLAANIAEPEWFAQGRQSTDKRGRVRTERSRRTKIEGRLIETSRPKWTEEAWLRISKTAAETARDKELDRLEQEREDAEREKAFAFEADRRKAATPASEKRASAIRMAHIAVTTAIHYLADDPYLGIDAEDMDRLRLAGERFKHEMSRVRLIDKRPSAVPVLRLVKA